MVAFQAGFFSWWTYHKNKDGVQFIATVFKQLFLPPTPANLQTLSEKTCLAYFVDNVVFRLFAALKLSMSEVSVFYRTWDTHRVVLTCYEQVSTDDVRVIQFRKYLQAKKKQNL